MRFDDLDVLFDLSRDLIECQLARRKARAADLATNFQDMTSEIDECDDTGCKSNGSKSFHR